MGTPLIETKGLKKYFKTARGMLHAVDDVNLSIEPGQTLGVVGESGCGKSTLGRTIIRLLEATDGEVLYEGKNILPDDFPGSLYLAESPPLHRRYHRGADEGAEAGLQQT